MELVTRPEWLVDLIIVPRRQGCSKRGQAGSVTSLCVLKRQDREMEAFSRGDVEKKDLACVCAYAVPFLRSAEMIC